MLIMIIIRRRRKKNTLFKEGETVTTYPPLVSGQNSKAKNGHGHRYESGAWDQTLRHYHDK